MPGRLSTNSPRACGRRRRERLSLREREARGILLADVEAIEEGGLAGRSLVTYARPGGRELGGSEIGVGSIVRVLPKREAADDAPSGIVARRQRALGRKDRVRIVDPCSGLSGVDRVAFAVSEGFDIPHRRLAKKAAVLSAELAHALSPQWTCE